MAVAPGSVYGDSTEAAGDGDSGDGDDGHLDAAVALVGVLTVAFFPLFHLLPDSGDPPRLLLLGAALGAVLGGRADETGTNTNKNPPADNSRNTSA